MTAKTRATATIAPMVSASIELLLSPLVGISARSSLVRRDLAVFAKAYADACHNLFKVKRFGDEVVGSRVQAGDRLIEAGETAPQSDDEAIEVVERLTLHGI